jgi:2-dehydrotetronate isomerase
VNKDDGQVRIAVNFFVFAYRMPAFSANLGFLWSDRPLLDRIDAAAKAGFRAVEFHWPYDVPALDLAKRCKQHNLTVLGINTPPSNCRGLGAQRGREQEFLETFEKVLAYATLINASAIHVMAGNVADQDKPSAREVFIRNLHAVAPKAAAQNITLLLEPLNLRDNPGYFYSTVAEGVSIIRELQLTNVKLQFDVYHVAIAEGDVSTKLRLHRKVIGNIQIASVPSRAEPDEGEIAYGEILKVIDEMGYRGWVGCEYKPRGDADEGLRWMRLLNVGL